MKLRYLLASLACSFAAVAVAETQAIQPDGQNSTAITSSSLPFGPETYTISLNAPKIDNHTFPVAVEYFDDLLTPHKALKATLNVPLSLKIENSRARRLLTLFTLDGSAAVPYGANLSRVDQIYLNNLSDTAGHLALERFVGPNKKIFRAREDGKTFSINFILPITQAQFHEGFVKIAIAATNGVTLDQLCEVTAENCAHFVVFRIVPRKVVFSSAFKDISEYRKTHAENAFSLESSNVDLKVYIDYGSSIKGSPFMVNRHDLPKTFNTAFIYRMHDLHSEDRKAYKTEFTHIDMYPQVAYMSNDKYVPMDDIALTMATQSPELYTRNDGKAARVLNNLDALSSVVPFDGSVAEGTEAATPAAK